MATVDSLSPTAEQLAKAERTQETLAVLLNTDADRITIDYEPTPMVAQRYVGCIAVSDIGDLCPPDAYGWYEDSRASMIAIIRPARGLSPYQERDEIESLHVKSDCPPYRVLKTLLDNGVDL